MSVTVLICTFNRRALLLETLDSLARMDGEQWKWDVLIVDNNSTDGTREAVASRSSSFPVPLRYLHEPRQGKSQALNTGLAAITSAIVLFTDDDVRVPSRWLVEAAAPLAARSDIDYTGGPVRAIWGSQRPRWLPARNSIMWGTIAALDYGSAPFVFEDRRRIPLGVNMAVRRAVFDRIGMFDPALGRVGGSLLGQEQAEFFHRTRHAGIRGLYVPDMVMEHHVPATRLTRGYFRRWWYAKGIARARLHRRHPETDSGIDLRGVTRIARIPRFVLGEVVTHSRGIISGLLRLDLERAAEDEMLLVYSIGYMVESRRRPTGGQWEIPIAEEAGLAQDSLP